MARIFQNPDTKKWHLDYYDNKVRHRPVIGKKSDAEKALKQLRGERLLHPRPKTHATNDVSLTWLRDQWIEKHVAIAKRSSTTRSYASCVNQVLSRLDARTVADLTPFMVEEYRAGALQNGSQHVVKTKEGTKTIQRTVGLRTAFTHVGALLAMLKWAVKAQLIQSNPLEDFEQLAPKSKKFRRAMTPDEVRALLEKSPLCYSRVWQFLLGTGCRKSVAVNLTWENLDLDEETWFTPAIRDKMGKPRTLPLHPALVQMFAYMTEIEFPEYQDSDFVFKTRAGTGWSNNLTKRFASCLRLAGINPHGLCIHSLRHTFASNLIRQRVSIKTVQMLGGWKTTSTLLDIYAHAFPQDMADALKELSYFENETGHPDRQPYGHDMGLG